MSLLKKGMVPVQPYGQGMASATTWRNVADVTNLLSQEPSIKLFVEIGANYCGFAALMVSRTIIIPDFGYLGIEKVADRKNANLEKYMASQARCKIIWKDCFEEAVKAEVKEWISATKGRALVWCDGTDKLKEMKHYHPLLRKNDYLMLHDYSQGDLGSPRNPNWTTVKPYIESGQFKAAVPDYWAPSAGMYLMRRVEV